MSWQLFDRIRAFAKVAGVHQQERALQDQPSLDRILASGEFTDFSQQQALLDQTNLQINRLERYKDYDQMDEVGEISLALDLYADEASLVDPERKHVLVIKAKSRSVKLELERLFFNVIMIDNNVRPMVRYLCKHGDSPFEIIPTKDRKGVASLKFMNVYNFTRIETKFGDLVGFYYQDELMTEPVFLHPWQVMHQRLTSYDNIYHPYGRAILEGGRKAFKQLRLMEDAALIYRITRAPEKRIFKIPVGNIPAKEVPEYIQSIARQFKNNRFYDPRTGTFNERFSPLIQEDDFWLPMRGDGTGPSIETLKGAENLDQIKDIEYFKKKMVAPMKIPFKMVGIGDGAGEANDKSLSSSDAQFAKSVQWVQREVATQLTKVAICHLAMAGYSMEDLRNFSISMSATNAIDELYRMETWGGRTGVMSDLKDLKWFPREWIVARFTDLSPDEIQEIEELNAATEGSTDDAEDGGGALGGLGGAGGDSLGGESPDLGDLDSLAGDDGKKEPAGGDDNDLDLSAGAKIAAGGDDIKGEAPNIDKEVNDIADLGETTMTEKQMISEHKRQVRKQAIMEIVERARKRDAAQVSNGFEYLVERCELDGLPSRGKVLVESSISEAVQRTARNDYHMAISGKNDPHCKFDDSPIQE